MQRKVMEPTLLIERWKPLLRHWWDPQQKLRLVPRWSRFRSSSLVDRIALHPLWENARALLDRAFVRLGIARTTRQDTLMHTHGLLTLTIYVMHELRPHVQLNEALVLMVAHLHDQAEGELKKDVRATEKNINHDLQEYLAFMRLISDYDPTFRAFLQRLFLIPTALKEKELDCFPVDAHTIMRKLIKEHPMEVRVFNACENIDYFLYELREHLAGRHPDILMEIGNSVKALDKAAETIPGFTGLFWTPAMRAEALAYVAACNN